MAKEYRSKDQMSCTAYLDEAADWSRSLTRMKVRGPGDTENAMRMIEREYGVDYWVQWRLRYKRRELRDIGVSVYMALKAAYQAECERQMKKLERELELTKRITGSDTAAVRAAEALVATANGTVREPK